MSDPSSRYSHIEHTALATSSTSDHVAVLAALDYGQEDPHDRPTSDMFTALVSSYWPRLALGERRTIAKAVAGRADLSPDLIALFLDDHFTVANLVIDASPLLGDDDCRRIAESRVMPMIRVLARRDLPVAMVRSLAELGDSSTALALALNRNVELEPQTLAPLLDSAAHSTHVARALAQREGLPLTARISLFPELEPAARRLVIEHAERDALTGMNDPRDRVPAPALTEEQRLLYTELAKRIRPDDFIDRLNAALGVQQRYVEAMRRNDGGEIQAVALAALGFSASQTTTLLIIQGAGKGWSYTDIKDLIEIYERVKWRVASRFLTVWQGRRPLGPGDQTRAPSLEARTDTRRADRSLGDRGRRSIDRGAIPGFRSTGQ